MRASEILDAYIAELGSLYEQREAQGIFFVILEYYLGWKRSDYFLKKDDEFSSDYSQKFFSALQKLKKSIPVQYVLEQSCFYGRDFYVNDSVLIPRPETEELVDWILSENDHRRYSTLDIGAGSGVISVTLAAERPQWDVTALDVSVDALDVTRKNAASLCAEMVFLQVDILGAKSEDFSRKYDIVVSNPPYVTHNERTEMHSNVLENEPHLALFVSDDDPLIFYRKIAELSLDLLNEGGRIYFEINQSFGEKTVMLLKDLGYRDIELRKDMNGRDRMVRAVIDRLSFKMKL